MDTGEAIRLLKTVLTTLGIQYWPLPAMQLCNATDNFVYNPCNNTAKEHWRDWRRDKRDTVVLWACLHKTKQCSREVISFILAFNIYHKIVPVLTKYCWHNYRQPNHNCINTDVFQDRDKCILVIFSQKNSQEMVVCVCGGGGFWALQNVWEYIMKCNWESYGRKIPRIQTAEVRAASSSKLYITYTLS